MAAACDFPASTPKPPYFAVVFSSRLASEDPRYAATAARMVDLARQMDGFLGVESTRGTDGTGITVSYWRDEDAIRAWKNQAEHAQARRRGREQWYSAWAIRVCRVERAYGDGA